MPHDISYLGTERKPSFHQSQTKQISKRVRQGRSIEKGGKGKVTGRWPQKARAALRGRACFSLARLGAGSRILHPCVRRARAEVLPKAGSYHAQARDRGHSVDQPSNGGVPQACFSFPSSDRVWGHRKLANPEVNVLRGRGRNRVQASPGGRAKRSRVTRSLVCLAWPFTPSVSLDPLLPRPPLPALLCHVGRRPSRHCYRHQHHWRLDSE